MHRTLLQVNGPQVIVLLVLPVLVTLAPLLFPSRVTRVIATVLICGFTLVGSFTIGLFYLPAALAMLIAACAKSRQNFRNASN